MRKWIPGFEGRYKASSDGKVFSYCQDADGREIGSWNHGTGRYHVKLVDDGNRTHGMQRAKAVLLAFEGAPPDGCEACHNDSDPKNDALDNLRWDTCSANTYDAIDEGARPGLTREQRIEVIRLCETGKHTQRELAERYGVSQSTISYTWCNREKTMPTKTEICEFCDSPIPEKPEVPKPWPRDCEFAYQWGGVVQYYMAPFCQECAGEMTTHSEEWCACAAPPEFAEAVVEVQLTGREMLVCNDCGHSELHAWTNESELVEEAEGPEQCHDCGEAVRTAQEHVVIRHTKLTAEGVKRWSERYHPECLEAMRDEAETQRDALAFIRR